MPYETKPGGGAIFKSKDHDGGSRPTHYGEILLNDDLIEKIVANGYSLPVSGWFKCGDTWELISLSVDMFKLEPKDQPF